MIDSLFNLLIDLISTNQLKQNIDNSGDSRTMLSLMRSFACSSLLSLVVARGDTGKMLTAASALLTNPHLVNVNEEIETPNILIFLQKSVHAVLLGKTSRPDWLTNGFPYNSLCDSFFVHVNFDKSDTFQEPHKSSSLTFDGKYLYIFYYNTINKLGSGYGGTVKGQLIASRIVSQLTEPTSPGWIGFVKGYLYYQPNNWQKNELFKIDPESLKEVGKVTLGVPHWGPSVCTTDGENLILITSTKDDNFILRILKPSTSAVPSSITSVSASASTSSYLMPVVQELNLKLAHKCLAVCGGVGGAVFDGFSVVGDKKEQQNRHPAFRHISLNEEDEPLQIAAGKDFALTRTQSGKLFYSGKGQSLGIKMNENNGKWTELPIAKSPKIVNFSVGHEGSHAILVTDEGSVFFTGLAKRGEDGDLSKGRRQPKAVKPKKMVKMDGKCVVMSSCNHGTSALVTKDGGLYLFGKDTTHVDKSTGFVSGLKNVTITQVSLGKAHTLALSNKGQVYSFGFNHKGQCGHDFTPHSNLSNSGNACAISRSDNMLQTMAVEEPESISDQQLDLSEDVVEPLCSSGSHRWKYGNL